VLLIHIKDVIVLGRDKDRPKNDMERTVALNPRSMAVLRRQLALRDRYVAAGTIDHDFVFFTESGAPLRSSKYTYGRWLHTIEKLSIRYRKLCAARHSCVTWHLLIGKDKLWCSKSFGHVHRPDDHPSAVSHGDPFGDAPRGNCATLPSHFSNWQLGCRRAACNSRDIRRVHLGNTRR
jgi:hypothetical protein